MSGATSTPTTGDVPTAPALPRPRSLVSLSLLHLRFGLLETLRVPVAVVGTTVFPALAMLFFVVPQGAVAGNPVVATGAAAQLAVFAVLSTCVFTYGIGVAEDRQLPFDGFLRTLPAGAVPRMVGRVLTGSVFAFLGVVPLVVVAALLTEATITFPRLAAGLAMLAVVGIPFLLLGLGIGYSMSAKAATAVAQVVVFPLAFLGGLFIPPETFPRWLDTISGFLPSRAARDVVVPIAVGQPPSGSAFLVLLAWTAVLALLVVQAYRRDEGRRFR